MARKISSTQYRTFEFDRAAVNAESRTLSLAFSSEMPVEREFGMEVLDHDPESCDLSRLNNGAPLLFNHDPERQIGVVESASLENRTGKATVRFSKCDYAEDIFRDVQDGIRRKVSVGYRLNDRKKVEITEDGGLETYRFRNWQPFEISIVPIPADDSVGVNRGNQPSAEDFELPDNMNRNLLLNAAPADGGGGAPAQADKPEIVITNERSRSTEILKLAAKWRNRVADATEMANAAVERGISVSDFQGQLLDRMQTAPLAAATDAGSIAGNSDNRIRTLGELLVESDDYKALVGNGRSLKKGRFERSIDVPHVNVRATLTTTVAGLTKYERPPGIVLVEQQPLTVAQLIAPGTTENTTIRYMQEDTFTNAAAAVAEEGQIAEASWDLSEQDASVVKIGVLGRVTEEIFADSAAVQSYVNARLPWMVQAKEDNYLLNGTGLNNQVKGILNVTGVQTESAANSSTPLDAVHRAITKIRNVGYYEPDAILVHPTDWQNMKLTKDGNGQYLSGGPFVGAYGVGAYSNVMSLWGLPCVSTTAIAQGTALVGAFRLGAQVFRRQGLSIDTSNSDASDFQYGRIAIRVTERLALATYRPTAFCTVTGIPA